MNKIKIHYIAQAIVEAEIEVTDEELKRLNEVEISSRVNEKLKKHVDGKGFKNISCIEESYLDSGGNIQNCFDIISRASQPKNVIEFGFYIENIVFETKQAE